MPLNIHNHWVLLRTPGDPRGKAQILVLLGSPDRETRDRLERSVIDSAPRRLAALIEVETAQGEAPPAAPEDSGNPFAEASAGATPTRSSLGGDAVASPGAGPTTVASPPAGPAP
ncbi:hypothetical protein ACTMO5_15095, partial [Enterococcus faecium]|uniref:hypothetical protein n=1 Tax=Enterococcus faecium TaxID=1352 RepID=UPI003F8B0EF8